ncbi:ferredoxin, partial [Candidatus Woesearchaeota archaeon]|nr:ferredoxin [Candidatus Woesearchaeota archaeon]
MGNGKMGRKIQIIYTPGRCVGTGNCVLYDEADFSLQGGKAALKGGKPGQEPGDIILQREVNEQALEDVKKAAEFCPTNAIKIVDAENAAVIVDTKIRYAPGCKRIQASYDDRKEFTIDPNGYFLIRTNPKRKEIEVAFCKKPNQISLVVVGKKPLEIYQTVLKQNIISRTDHAAYLGREVQK